MNLIARSLLRGAALLTALAAAASCGSRTGLFIEPPESIPDAATDVIDDARRDAAVDAGPDVRDAALDATLDAIDDGPVACVPGTFGFTLATAQLMFVLDRSGSMDFELDTNKPAPAGQPTRWTALRDALAQTIVPFSDQIAMGARFYPAATADGFDPIQACIQDPAGVAIAPALSNASRILNVFSRTNPVGGTPTAVALQLAAQEVSSSRAVARAIVVATDGAPNCNAALLGATCTCTSSTVDACKNNPTSGTNCLDDTRTVETLTEIFTARKIPVYVVGIGVTSSFGATLDAMALAGGRPRNGSPRYYPADTPGEMSDAFEIVRDSVAKCSYITPSSPDDADAISVSIAGANVLRDPGHLDGWDWIDQAYGHLQLFGSACATATRTNVSGTVSCNKDR